MLQVLSCEFCEIQCSKITFFLQNTSGRLFLYLLSKLFLQIYDGDIICHYFLLTNFTYLFLISSYFGKETSYFGKEKRVVDSSPRIIGTAVHYTTFTSHIHSKFQLIIGFYAIIFHKCLFP